MKKGLLFIIFLFTSNICFSQSQHLSFMKSSINGNIDTFQSKLSSLGFIPYKELNLITPKGMRVFNGRFAGEMANVIVYYCPVTMNVFKVRVAINDNNEARINSLFDKFQKALTQNYSNYTIKNRKYGVFNAYCFSIYKPNTNRSNDINLLGHIYLYKHTASSSFSSSELYNYGLYVDYIDKIGKDNYEKKLESFF